MNRLQSELHRLYLPQAADGDQRDGTPSSLVSQNGMVRAMVLELARPANWEEMAVLWHAVQTDLELPAPAVAVSGRDGFQLWFSLAEAVTGEQAHAFLESARARYLPDIAKSRVTLWPAIDTETSDHVQHARTVPALQDSSGYWSAYLTPNMAAVFSDTPWMDIQPSDAGQAGVLRRLSSIPKCAFVTALTRLQPAASELCTPTDTGVDALPTRPAAAVASLDPRQFLLQVMNDSTAALALRIEAAKALLPYSDRQRT